MLLAACGGGGDGVAAPAAAPCPPIVVVPAAITQTQAGRFFAQAGNGSATLTCVNPSGNAVYLAGRSTVQYAIGASGPISLLKNAASQYGSSTAAAALHTLMTASNTHLLAG